MRDAGKSPPEPANGYVLGDWQVFPDAGLLFRAGQQNHAEPKVMSVLECLMQAQGRVVSREELIERVWIHVVVNDEVLTRAISELRMLLDDAAREPRYIVTVPKRGYKLVMPVLPLPAPGDISSLAHGNTDTSIVPLSVASGWLSSAGNFLRQPMVLAGSLSLVSVFAFSLWVALGAGPGEKSGRTHPDRAQESAEMLPAVQAELRRHQVDRTMNVSADSVSPNAALPVFIRQLTLITEDDRTRIFAAGLAEDLQHAIFRLTDLQLVHQPPADDLEGALILNGSVRVYEQSTKVNLQLVEAGTSRVIWSSAFDCPLDATMSVQARIARQATLHLQNSLSRKV